MPERKSNCLLGDVLESLKNDYRAVSRRRMTTVRCEAKTYHFQAFKMTVVNGVKLGSRLPVSPAWGKEDSGRREVLTFAPCASISLFNP
jgi:hypothetical protein